MNQGEIFISYAHSDRELAKKLLDNLSVLEDRFTSLYIWSSDNIIPGQNWLQTIREHLEEAKIIILLVSRAFLALENNELSIIEAKWRDGTALVIPIILRPTDLSQTFIANIKPLPHNGKPLSTWKSPNLAYREIIDEIEEAIMTSNIIQDK